MLRCGQAGARIRSASGSLLENKMSEHSQQSPGGGVMEQTNWAV